MNVASNVAINLNISDEFPYASGSSSNDTDDSLYCTEGLEWKKTDRIYLALYSGFIVLLGTTGNTIAYFVLKQKSYKHNVMSGALRYLALLDNVILWTVVLRIFVKGLLDTDVAHASTKVCL